MTPSLIVVLSPRRKLEAVAEARQATPIPPNDPQLIGATIAAQAFQQEWG